MRAEMTFDEAVEFLRAEKEHKGLTYTRVGEESGVHAHTCKMYLTGKVKNQTGDTLERIAAGIGVDLRQRFIRGGQGEKWVDTTLLKENIKTFMALSPFTGIQDRAICRIVCKSILEMIERIEVEETV